VAEISSVVISRLRDLKALEFIFPKVSVLNLGAMQGLGLCLESWVARSHSQQVAADFVLSTRNAGYYIKTGGLCGQQFGKLSKRTQLVTYQLRSVCCDCCGAEFVCCRFDCHRQWFHWGVEARDVSAHF